MCSGDYQPDEHGSGEARSEDDGHEPEATVSMASAAANRQLMVLSGRTWVARALVVLSAGRRLERFGSGRVGCDRRRLAERAGTGGICAFVGKLLEEGIAERLKASCLVTSEASSAALTVHEPLARRTPGEPPCSSADAQTSHLVGQAREFVRQPV
jgi:hypothetical protein